TATPQATGASPTSHEDVSRHKPAAPVPPSTAYTAASSTAAHAPASPESPSGPRPLPTCASQTHGAAYADAHPPPVPGSKQSPSQSVPHSASSTGNPPASADSS